MKKLVLIFSTFLILTSLTAQKVTLSGIVKDAANGETIVGAYIILKDSLSKATSNGAVTNTAGFYSITVEKGIYILNVNYLGYKPISEKITITSNLKKNIEIMPSAIIADEVVVKGEAADKNVSGIDVGKMEMKIETIKSIPAFMGEADVIRSIQLLPGIQSGSEGNSGFYVRGGNSDQNLVMLDETPIFNPGHLFGFFFIFNADALKSVDVIKSGMPANYGGRLASIVDVYQKEGNMKNYELDGGIGVIFSRFTVQGPIKKDKASFIFSGRRTYIDWLIQPFLKTTSPFKGAKFYFYDLNGKFNIIVNDKHRLYIGGYYGDDVYGFKSTSGNINSVFAWGNGAASVRWNYIITPKLFLNTSGTFSDYKFKTKMKQGIYNFAIGSGIRDYALKTELTFLPNPKHNTKFGVYYIFHTFFPSNFDVEAGEGNFLTFPKTKPFYANELSVYANDEWDIVKWLKVSYGIRYSHFSHIGTFTRFVLDEQMRVLDSIQYKPGQMISQYNYPEPRLSARFLLDTNTSVKTSYTFNCQYLHQISLATISLPTDVWVPSTEFVKPQTGHQVSLGVFRNFYNNMFEAYIDAYYKTMNNLTEYKDGMDLSTFQVNSDQRLTQGKGYSCGVEFFLQKNRGRFTGFVGYTLSFTQRKFSELNKGEWFWAKYDRRHDVSVSLNYEIIRNKLSVAAVWVFASGNTMTIPVGYYFFNGDLMTEYNDRNAYRLPPYHRLDLSVNWNIVKRKHFETGLNFSIYNVYNRKNPFFIFYETTTNFDPTTTPPVFEIETKAYKMSLFPIIPSINWNFKIK
ncbi:MAG: TonB-dependent receptor [Bacteroidetes bacterium]|nr:TonB-dependent receptor [Bacteroidota bacterium]MCL1968805.1 TonB-dependent receptor [Bacteroidota bacterium]